MVCAVVNVVVVAAAFAQGDDTEAGDAGAATFAVAEQILAGMPRFQPLRTGSP